MTIISWSMLILGIVIGLIPTVLIANKFEKDLASNAKLYADILDMYVKQNAEDQKRIDNYTNSIRSCVEDILAICEKSMENNVEFASNFVNLVKKDHETIKEHLNGWREPIQAFMTTEDERWGLISEYFINNKEG